MQSEYKKNCKRIIRQALCKEGKEPSLAPVALRLNDVCFMACIQKRHQISNTQFSVQELVFDNSPRSMDH